MIRFIALFVALELTFLVKSEINGEFMNELLFPNVNKLKENYQDVELLDFKLNSMNNSMLQKLNKLKNRKDFEKFFGILKPELRISAQNEAAAVDLENAGCTPLLAPVQLMPSNPLLLYYPTCVLLERCGGCCYGSQLSCQPIEVEPVKLNVVKLKVMNTPSSNKRDRTPPQQETKIVEEVRHKKCACKCTLQESECNPDTQKYNSNECKCDCIDTFNRKRCDTLQNSHFWDLNDCRCYCRNVPECSTGQYFDHDPCECQATPFSLRSLSFDNEFNG